jgi:hypothetical protein
MFALYSRQVCPFTPRIRVWLENLETLSEDEYCLERVRLIHKRSPPGTHAP